LRFLIDAMLPPQVAEHLNALDHDAVTPAALGAHTCQTTCSSRSRPPAGA
jgi:hypothetical protein